MCNFCASYSFAPGWQLFSYNPAASADYVVVGAVHADAVDFEEGQHDVHTNTLVAVDKSVVGDQCIAETGGFFLLAGVKLLAVKTSVGALKRGVEQRFIAYSNAAAGGLSHYFVQQQYLFL